MGWTTAPFFRLALFLTGNHGGAWPLLSAISQLWRRFSPAPQASNEIHSPLATSHQVDNEENLLCTSKFVPEASWNYSCSPDFVYLLKTKLESARTFKTN